MKTFIEFLDEDFNEIYDFISEEFIFEAEAMPQLKQPWPNFEPKNGNKEYSHEEFKKFVHKHIKPKIDKVEKPFHKLLHSVRTGGADVKAARKSLESLHDKVVKRNRPASEVHDVIRGAILTKDKEHAEKVMNKLKETGKVIKHEYKNHEEGGKESGYGGTHHAVVDLGGVQAEIQVMPKKIFKAKEDAHRIYKKYRSMKNPEQHEDYAKDMEKSKSIFKNAIKKVNK
jgi:hypothetical protein